MERLMLQMQMYCKVTMFILQCVLEKQQLIKIITFTNLLVTHL